MRCVLLDPEDHLLLQQGDDPYDPTIGAYWFLPGGGIDGREAPAEALRRELWEECGIEEVEVGPLLWQQRTQFRFAGIDFDQDEDIHLARVRERVAIRPQALEALEAAAFKGARWWPMPHLSATEEVIYPLDLSDRLKAVGLL